MQKALVTVVLGLLFTTLAYGEGQIEAQKPTTKLEAFKAKTGIVVVRGYTTVGSMVGSIGGKIIVDARDFRDASNPKGRTTGISITVSSNNNENTAYIDSDEISSLLSGIEYISKTTKDITKLSNFEVEYRTKGDFSIGVFNNSKGEMSVAVSAGNIGRTRAFIKLEQLAELQQLILDAKSKL